MSSGFDDGESVEADTLAGAFTGVEAVGVLSRATKLACPMSKGTKKYVARATRDRKSVVPCFDIYFHPSAGEQGGRTTGAKQLTRGGIHLVDINRGYTF